MATESPAIDGAFFAEVECRQSQALCQQHGAGQGGWPTLITFDASTGTKGRRFVQKKAGMVCDELKVPARMREHVVDSVAVARAAAAAKGGVATEL